MKFIAAVKLDFSIPPTRDDKGQITKAGEDRFIRAGEEVVGIDSAELQSLVDSGWVKCVVDAPTQPAEPVPEPTPPAPPAPRGRPRKAT